MDEISSLALASLVVETFCEIRRFVNPFWKIEIRLQNDEFRKTFRLVTIHDPF